LATAASPRKPLDRRSKARTSPAAEVLMVRIATRCVALLALAASHAAAAEWPDLELQQRFDGFVRPVAVEHAGDGTGRLFVVEQIGRIVVIEDGRVLAEPFLDISDRISCCGERGLLGLAFPPGFAVSGRLYVNYTDGGGDTVVARFRVGASPNRADPTTEQVLLTIQQPYSNHNGGQLAFGPDGYLYIGTGDGGSAGDPQNNAQDPLSLLGKVLRIDVESGDGPYRIPDSNPFAFDDGHQPEIWALGLRNPWRFSFDRLTGDLYIADVGQSSFEEVNFQPAASGGGENYGWRIMEAGHCFNPDPCDTTGLVLPAAEYDHSLGCSVTGGRVYRGERWPRLNGVYLYGDYCSGRIWGLRRLGDAWESRELSDTDLTISTFGTDEAGVVYVADYASGALHTVTDPDVEELDRLVVPAVAHLTGAGGTRWRADLTVVNSTSQDARLTLTFRADGGEDGVETELLAGRSIEWRDVLVSLFGRSDGDQVAGTVEILADVPVAATARSYADVATGTYGQLLPALSSSDAIGPGEAGLLAGIARSPQRYTNLGVVNLGPGPCAVAVRLFDSDGSTLGAPIQFQLEAAEWRQVFDVLAAAGDREAAWARVEVLTPEGQAWAYASVIDRLSRDPTTIPLQRAP
jgi:glucose/arabinose dehydrogenase